MEEGIIWGQVWPRWCYINTSGIKPVLNHLIYLARNYVHFWLCISGHMPGWSWCGFHHTKALKALALGIYCVCWEMELFPCKETICTVMFLPIRGNSGERLEIAQSTCCKFKRTEGCSKCYLQVALFSSNGRDLPLPSPPAQTRYGDWREEGSHLFKNMCPSLPGVVWFPFHSLAM